VFRGTQNGNFNHIYFQEKDNSINLKKRKGKKMTATLFVLAVVAITLAEAVKVSKDIDLDAQK